MPEIAPRKTLPTAQRHAEWLELRTQGKTYRAIAEQYGVDHKTVMEAVKKALREVKREQAEELVELELSRLDAMFDSVVGVLNANNYTVSNGRLIYLGDADEPLRDNTVILQCIDRLVKISESRRKLLGLDSPTKQNVGLEVKYTIEGVDLGSLQ